MAGRYAALYPTGFPWSTTAQRMPFHSSNGKIKTRKIDFKMFNNRSIFGQRYKFRRVINYTIISCKVHENQVRKGLSRSEEAQTRNWIAFRVVVN